MGAIRMIFYLEHVFPIKRERIIAGRRHVLKVIIMNYVELRRDVVRRWIVN